MAATLSIGTVRIVPVGPSTRNVVDEAATVDSTDLPTIGSQLPRRRARFGKPALDVYLMGSMQEYDLVVIGSGQAGRRRPSPPPSLESQSQWSNAGACSAASV